MSIEKEAGKGGCTSVIPMCGVEAGVQDHLLHSWFCASLGYVPRQAYNVLTIVSCSENGVSARLRSGELTSALILSSLEE